MVTYYYLLMTQKDLLENQVFEEIVRERANYYLTQKKSVDFWILINPTFIKELNLSKKVNETLFYKIEEKNIIQQNIDFFGAIISLNKDFIQWIQLRYGYFEDLELEVVENLPLNYKINGIIGKLNSSETISPLDFSNLLIKPSIFLQKSEKTFNVLYQVFDRKPTN